MTFYRTDVYERKEERTKLLIFRNEKFQEKIGKKGRPVNPRETVEISIWHIASKNETRLDLKKIEKKII